MHNPNIPKPQHNDIKTHLALSFFLLNNLLAGLTTYVFYWLATVKHKEMSFEMETQKKMKFTSDTLFTIIILAIVILVTFLTD